MVKLELKPGHWLALLVDEQQVYHLFLLQALAQGCHSFWFPLHHKKPKFHPVFLLQGPPKNGTQVYQIKEI